MDLRYHRISWSAGCWIRVHRQLPTRAQRQVALTIDDGPNPNSTPQLLGLLAAAGATATFFLSGFRLADHLDLAAQIVQGGHSVYAHGWDHIRLDQAGPQRLIADMTRCEALLAQIRPTPSPYLVRLPYNAGWRNRTVHRALRQWQPNCQIVHWGPAMEDHAITAQCQTPRDIPTVCQTHWERVLADPRLPGGILLMHDQPILEHGDPLQPQTTLTVMETVLRGLARAGYRTVPLHPLPPQPGWARFAMVW